MYFSFLIITGVKFAGFPEKASNIPVKARPLAAGTSRKRAAPYL